jgi:hypothetical protein
MKKTLVISLLVGAAIVGSLCGCASNQGQKTAETEQPKPAKPPKDKRSIEDRLAVGMTMDQVIQACGKPKGKSVSSDGAEIWTYNNNQNAWIPYYSMSGGKFHTVVVVFDTNGKVKSWSSSSQGMY